MRIKVVGFIDTVIDVNQYEYEEALAIGELSKFMEPILSNIEMDITFGKEDEFSGSSL